MIWMFSCELAIPDSTHLNRQADLDRHDDSTRGPMTRCSLKVLEPEDHMNQELDTDNL